MNIDLYQYEALCVLAITNIIIILIIAVVYSRVHNNELYRHIERLEADIERPSSKKNNNKDDNDNNESTIGWWTYEYKKYKYK